MIGRIKAKYTPKTSVSFADRLGVKVADLVSGEAVALIALEGQRIVGTVDCVLRPESSVAADAPRYPRKQHGKLGGGSTPATKVRCSLRRCWRGDKGVSVLPSVSLLMLCRRVEPIPIPLKKSLHSQRLPSGFVPLWAPSIFAQGSCLNLICCPVLSFWRMAFLSRHGRGPAASIPTKAAARDAGVSEELVRPPRGQKAGDRPGARERSGTVREEGKSGDGVPGCCPPERTRPGVVL